MITKPNIFDCIINFFGTITRIEGTYAKYTILVVTRDLFSLKPGWILSLYTMLLACITPNAICSRPITNFFIHSDIDLYKSVICVVVPDTKNSSGIIPNTIEEVAHNAVTIMWKPMEDKAKVIDTKPYSLTLTWNLFRFLFPSLSFPKMK